MLGLIALGSGRSSNHRGQSCTLRTSDLEIDLHSECGRIAGKPREVCVERENYIMSNSFVGPSKIELT